MQRERIYGSGGYDSRRPGTTPSGQPVVRESLPADCKRETYPDATVRPVNMRHIGTERDALLRQKQLTGQAGFFADEEFSPGDADEEAAENGPQPPSYSGTAIRSTGCSRFGSSGWD